MEIMTEFQFLDLAAKPILSKSNNMPILLQINVTANWGSTGKIAEQIGLCAMAHGWQSYIAYGRMMNSSKSQLIKIGTKADVYEHFAEQLLFDDEGLSSRFATKCLINKIEKINPDIVQLHNIHDHYLNYKILFDYFNRAKTKVVWTFHDCWAFTGHCFHFVPKDCDRWKIQCYDCPLKNEYPKTIIDRSYKNYNLKKFLFSGSKNLTIVPASYWMANFVKQSFLKDKRVEVIHNGVDLNVYKPMGLKASALDGKFRIIAVSNIWNSDKGEQDVYKLREMLPVDEYEITMVGLSASQISNLPRGIEGIQRTQNVNELVRLYSNADVLVNPTYADTFPTINLEALATGTPVITYRTGGSPEAIDDRTGVVVEQGNVEALAEVIRRMKIYPLSSNDCRNRAELYFDKDKCFEKYIQLYEQLINQ